MLEQLGINLKVVAVQVMAFLLLFAILYKFLFKRVADFMKSRTEGIEASFQKIEQDRVEIDRLTKEYQPHLANIEKEAYNRIKEAVKERIKAKNEIVAQAQTQAQQTLEKARNEIAREKEKCLFELRREVIGLSLQIAEKLTDATMNAEIHGKLVDGFLNDVEKVRRG